MLWVIGFLFAGMIIGILLRRKTGLLKPVDKTISLLVYLLLFTLGLSAGTNKAITTQFHFLGFKAILVSLFTTAGSIFVGWFIYKQFFVKEQNEK